MADGKRGGYIEGGKGFKDGGKKYGMNGVGWYVGRFNLGEGWDGKGSLIDLGGI